MSLRKTLRAQICRYEGTANYPIGEFENWAFGLGISRTTLMQELDRLQKQLDSEAKALRERPDTPRLELNQLDYWRFYCAQVRSHYRMLARLAMGVH